MDPRYAFLNSLLHVMVFLLGAGIGSFLNVVIYRLPLGMSLDNPRRSFCPSCKKQIPWYHNIPLLSWLL
ncbi:MAG: type iv leader peptidase family, partial [Verrucomicrobiaceae bacterium]|nr:type iv leader peptidase family [Verrucomicrobiaceae bacterium]